MSSSQPHSPSRKSFFKRLTSFSTSPSKNSAHLPVNSGVRSDSITGREGATSQHRQKVDQIIYKQRRLEELAHCLQTTREILRDLRADYDALRASSWSLGLHLCPATTAAIIGKYASSWSF